MTGKGRPAVAALLAVATLTGACATTIAGSARPVPGQAAVQPVADPCSLVTPEQSASLGLEATGKLTEADPRRRVPANCVWHQSDEKAEYNPLTVAWSIDISLESYLDGALPGDQFQFGGRTWTRYASAFGKAFCLLETKLSEKSFVEVSSSDTTDEAKSCDLAKAGAPLVASHLPAS